MLTPRTSLTQYSFVVPEGFQRAEILPPSTTLGSMPQMMDVNKPPEQQGPVSAAQERFVLPGKPGVQLILAVKSASQLRQTFRQLNDLSEWGDPDNVRPLLLPFDAQIERTKRVILDRGVRDTVLGRYRSGQDAW